MKSIKTEKNFSFEDFEKGLMLAGYVMPSSIHELNEREELEKYEKELQSKPKNIYFKRVVLAAEIASKLYMESTLGRVKFQKLVYLCEHVAKMNLIDRYTKQTAGPFDNKFMHTIDNEFKSQKWFSVDKLEEGNITRYKYTKLENSENYKKYYENYFSNENDKIQFIIELFRKRDTRYTELSATVFACYHELSFKNEKINKKELVMLFYNWSPEKKKFSEKEISDNLNWLNENGLITFPENI